MKILFITPKFYPEIGGVEKHTYCVANALSKYLEIDVLTSTQLIGLEPKEQKGKLCIHRIFLVKKGNNLLNSIFFIVRKWLYLLKNLKFLLQNTVIHLHDYDTFLWVAPFVFFLRKRLFITFHGYESYPIPLGSRAIRKIAENCVCGNICIGRFISKWYGTQTQFSTIGAVEDPDLTELDHLNNEGVFIGRLAEDTGIMELLKSLSIVKAKYGITVPLHICADGNLRSHVLDYAEQNNLIIIMHGFVPHPEKFLAKCRYAFVTGYLSILEAMSYKSVVLSIYSNPLKRDYLYSISNAEDMMIIASSPEELAENIYCAINNPNQTNLMSQRAYEFAIQQSWHKLAMLYLELYRGIR